MKRIIPLLIIIFFFCQCEKEIIPEFSDFTDTRDGYTYKTVQIGEQTWFAENLRYLPEVHPDNNVSATEIQFFVNAYGGNNVEEAKARNEYLIYGALYNRPSAVISCPSGWHLPSDSEWEELAGNIGRRNGASLRSVTHWPSDMQGNNISGMNILPYGNDADFCALWSSDRPTDVPNRVYFWGFPWSEKKFEHDDGDNNAIGAVRCLKD